MPAPPTDKQLTDLEALSRRLLALAGDVKTPLAHDVEIAGIELQIPVADEVARIDIELTAIWSSLTALAAAAGVTLPDDLEQPTSRIDAPAVYAAMQRRAEHQRHWVGVVRERWTGAPAEPAVDNADDPTSRDLPGHLFRRLMPYGQWFIFLAIVTAAYAYNCKVSETDVPTRSP